MTEAVAYRAGAYLRLSREDEEQNGKGRPESNSISSQRELIVDFIGRQPDIRLHDIYADDGYSGADFERPGFQRMLHDIYGGRLNCVVVKDLSRFGRDYIEAGRLIQKVFPALQVRFVAVCDRYDSLTADYGERTLLLPVRNFFNDAYCQDISTKVKSHQRTMREHGEFIGAFAAYGYRRKEADRHVLEPDGFAAIVVRHIFYWRLMGLSCLAIARRLDRLGILTPLEYKRLHGGRYFSGFWAGSESGWSSVTVARILADETYTGTLVQGRQEKISCKVRRSTSKPAVEWVRVKQAHEAIVDEETFELASGMFALDGRTGKDGAAPPALSGLAFCGDCGGLMVRRSGRSPEGERFICGTRNRGKGCTRHCTDVTALTGAVRQCLELLAEVMSGTEAILAQLESGTDDRMESTELTGELELLKTEISGYERLLGRLAGDVSAGLLTREDAVTYQEIYDCRLERLKKKRERQERLARRLQDAEIKWRTLAWKDRNSMAWDRLDLLEFVSDVRIFEDNRVELKLRFAVPKDWDHDGNDEEVL